MKIGLYYGSTTGNTEYAADVIANKFGTGLIAKSVDRVTKEENKSLDIIIFGISTWNIGELEMTWEVFFPELVEIDFSGKYVALFGMGDQANYSDTYLDALGILYDKLTERGASIIGSWPIDGYNFSASLAVHENEFVGLALDQDNQSDLTDQRIDQWVKELKKFLSISSIEAIN